ncbi:MAG: hypothetical protein PVH40_09425 [Gemmatimonadales bacterium]
MRVFDVSDPVDPREVSEVGDGRPWFGVAVRNQYAFAGGESGLAIVDISDVARPVIGRERSRQSG